MEFADLILTPKLDGVVMNVPFKRPLDGTLCITGHHLIISTRRDDEEELWLLHENIDVIERKSSSNISGGTIIIKCKDFRIILVDIKSSEDFNNVALSLERLSSLDDPTLKYPFFFQPMYPILEDGWSIFGPETEFSKLLQTDDWKITNVNADYSVCSSYPSVIVVPKVIEDDVIKLSARFRDGGRFPVISYRHECGAILVRSSQPLTGPNNKRCKEDERIVNSMLVNGKRGYIIDTRSQTSAQAAKARGGGYEIEIHYPQWKRVHNNIEKHQNLQESLSKLIDACNDQNCSVDKWLSRLDSSGWLSHVTDALNCACLVAQFLDQEGCSVLIHGTEGMDSSLLVSSLAQVILNPDCRTIRGLEAVIEREWIQAGHPFAVRNIHSAYFNPGFRNRSVAPTFLLFLDCLSQLHYQFPCSFEFSTGFLILLFEHSYFSQFGTFLCNNEMEREKYKVKKNSTSLWSYINRPEILESILNSMYEPNKGVIWPSVAPMSMNLWTEMFLRWVIDQKEERSAWEKINKIKETEKDLQGQSGRLQRQLAELEKEARSLGLLEGETLPRQPQST